MKSIVVIFIFCSIKIWQADCKGPNIVFILTDDEDVEIGGMDPIVKSKALIGDAGITFKNMYVTSPLCCPSRSSILTGNYIHNGGARNNSLSGNCSSAAWQQTAERNTFATKLHDNGYKTFFAGKYLNQYGKKAAGGVEHVPPGWDEWHGLVGNSKYYNYTLSVNGKAEVHGDKYSEDYLTDVIGRRSVDFIEGMNYFKEPFFMMLSTPACHAPFTPAPQYGKTFSNVSAPRNGSFNKYDKNRHWLARSVKHPLGNQTMKLIDPVYRNRWRTLLSVDDLVENVIQTLDKKGFLDNTYVIYASDNGYHLGQLSLPYDKRQLYEFDIKVPLMIRGPGIQPKQTRKEVVLNIDLAPTFIDLANVNPPSNVDGKSIKEILLSNKTQKDWRQDFMVEHFGEETDMIDGCPALNHQRLSNCYPDCVCEDAYNNTYTCVRTISSTTNLMYCEFADTEDYVEVYDLSKDPHQLDNVAKTLDPNILMAQNKRLVELAICQGPSCRAAEPYPPRKHSWAATPNNDKATPNNDKATPNHDKATPNTDKATPNTDKATPNTDKATPNTDKATPNTDKATPNTDKATPNTDKATPNTDKATPNTDKATPNTDKATPNTDEGGKSLSDVKNDRSDSNNNHIDSIKDLSNSERDGSDSSKDQSDSDRDLGDSSKDQSDSSKDQSDDSLYWKPIVNGLGDINE